MPVLINFKICDNSEDCLGIPACPTGAFHWDEKNRKIAVDNVKCVSCGKCEEACQVGAIRVAKNDAEYKRIKKEIDNDPRKVSDLFVDRYGAQPISSAFLSSPDKFDIQILRATKPAVVELFNHNSIQCLLSSIPVKELFENEDIVYRKLDASGTSLCEDYKIESLPALVFFKNGKSVGKICGYYYTEQEKELLGKIKKIIAKSR